MGVRTYPDKPRIYCDMDGVIADFEGECKLRGLAPAQLKKIHGIYRYFQLVDGAAAGIFSLLSAGWEVFILTKIPADNTTAATDKLNWVNDNFPAIGERVIITPDKGCVGTERDFLIDDFPEWANCAKFRGTLLKFGKHPSPDCTKEHVVVPDWPAVVAYFRQLNSRGSA